ncbi:MULTISPECIES: SMI1/KNR4 family protein [Paenibacillus]|uniref:SMI1/KNR4 family protein n=1 Tax=Paenibacillus TaxID=44249 RepID=UPI0007858C54|nr:MULTISPECIES: SMI1/KNR4 family protein [Paenibacillus]MEC0127796.1 SMI1/KNR4 family protein [Paenibacillus pabuli]NEU64574.1 SMI1/KNR4 family protein [Paenibacillus sp. ALJ109b]
MKIKTIVKQIEQFDDCMISPPIGLPRLSENHILPEDVKEFYQICGGIKLFEGKDFGVDIVSPEKFVLANPVIVNELCEYDISSNWYIIADDRNGDFLTIDLHKDRLGRCYDSHWDTHAVAGSCAIISNSFTELLSNLVETKGQGTTWFWDEDDFEPLGDAYDNLTNE